MDNSLKKEITVLSSLCDAEGKLGIPNVFDICMDLAAEHAAKLHVSYYDMLAERCYWVAVRTRVRFYRRPKLMESVHAETWPAKPGVAKCDRFYRITAGDEILAEGRTEWTAQDLDTGMVRRSSSYGYPSELTHREDRVCESPFTRFRDFDGTEEVSASPYTVCAMDIDMGKHMNNVAYIRMLLNTFTTDELAFMDISEMEISYRLGCYEGEALQIERVRREGGWFFAVKKGSGETAAHARILTHP